MVEVHLYGRVPGRAGGDPGHQRYPGIGRGAAVGGGGIRQTVIPTGGIEGNNMVAIVQRKTLDNLLADFAMMPVLHQKLAELDTHNNHALVIEAPYADFLNPKRVHHYTPSFCAKAIAELYALHPNLRVVFCVNRKVANEWTRHYFASVWDMAQGMDK